MGIENLDRLFHPKSVALIGASPRPERIGNAILKNLLSNNFGGTIIPINPRHEKILELPTYGSIADMPDEVDLVVAATPIQQAPDIVRHCGEKAVGGVVVIAGGGKETGNEGKKIESDILQSVKEFGIRVIGPNCLGVINTQSKLNASFSNQSPIAGKMAFISQSGGINTAILDLSKREHIGFSYFVSLGSMIDVNFGDMIDYIGGDPAVSSIVMYVENLTRFRSFMSAARAVSRVKPIIAFKAGRTKAGAAAAMSHTGAMAGEDAVYDAAFKRAGIIRVKTFEELFDCAELAAKQPQIKGSGLAILTNSGGPGVMAADALSDYGATPVTFLPETLHDLDAVLPAYWSRANPVDILGDATEALFSETVRICSNAKEVNGILVILAPDAVNDPTKIAKALVEVIKQQRFPVFTVWLGGDSVEEGRIIFNQAGIPTFDSPERAIRAYMDLYHYARNIEALQQIPPRLPQHLSFRRKESETLINEHLRAENYRLSEIEAKTLLELYGIPVNRTLHANTGPEAIHAAKIIGFPVAMKVSAKDISHKSDAGGVRLNLITANEVSKIFDEMTTTIKQQYPFADINGVTIQQMLPPATFELIVGAKKDPDFGPVLLFGLGGILTEVLQDTAIGLPPLNRLLARNIIESTKAYRLLKGFRHIQPANVLRLEEILIRLAQLVIDFPQIAELDINPLLVKDNDFIAVDARILLHPSNLESPHHLVISPYPADQERTIFLEAVGDILVRPIRPEDAPLMISFFDLLSRQTIYNRFFTPLRKLPHYMLTRFTQIDYDREIALVAIWNDGQTEKMLGVARIIDDKNTKEAEFAVLVGDPWHGQGIGAALLTQCLTIAKSRHIRRVWGSVLATNTQMLCFGKKLGFKIDRSKDTREFLLSFDLEALPMTSLN